MLSGVGHGSKKGMTPGYIQAGVKALWPLYGVREKKLRNMIGLDTTASTAPLSETQQGIVAAALALLKQAGIEAADLAQLQAIK